MQFDLKGDDFMNFKNKLQKLFLLLLLIIPFNVFAYSEYIIPGGGNIGIEVNSDGIMVVGFYEVNGKNIGKNSGFQVGDRIIKVSGNDVTSIDNMVKLINTTMQNNIVNFTALRANKEVDINLEVFKDKSGVYKTGLYVKDSITGIGTLTYIDPETKIFGALGHEIIEANSNIKMEIKEMLCLDTMMYQFMKKKHVILERQQAAMLTEFQMQR